MFDASLFPRDKICLSSLWQWFCLFLPLRVCFCARVYVCMLLCVCQCVRLLLSLSLALFSTTSFFGGIYASFILSIYGKTTCVTFYQLCLTLTGRFLSIKFNLTRFIYPAVLALNYDDRAWAKVQLCVLSVLDAES